MSVSLFIFTVICGVLARHTVSTSYGLVVWNRDINPVSISVNVQLQLCRCCSGKGHHTTRTYNRVSGFGVPELGCEEKGLLGEEGEQHGQRPCDGQRQRPFSELEIRAVRGGGTGGLWYRWRGGHSGPDDSARPAKGRSLKSCLLAAGWRELGEMGVRAHAGDHFEGHNRSLKRRW